MNAMTDIPQTCLTCQGEGAYDPHDGVYSLVHCESCDGTGQVSVAHAAPPAEPEARMTVRKKSATEIRREQRAEFLDDLGKLIVKTNARPVFRGQTQAVEALKRIQGLAVFR